MNINSLYICVDDMNRAIDFYTALFEKEPVKNDPVYSVFDVGGFRFGLFAYKEMHEKHSYGNNCLPSISAGSLEILKEKIRDKEICFPLTLIGSNWVAEFADSEGNHIEITAPENQREV